jgi:hypothetical protein
VAALEIIGTVAIFAFSLMCAYVALNVERFTRFGQEALLAAAALLFTAGLMRICFLWGLISRENAVLVNSAAAIAFVLIGLQLTLMRYVYEKGGTR